MYCVIFGARPVTQAMLPYYGTADYAIAADAGYQTMHALGLVPDLLLGDYDSAPPPRPAENVTLLPCEKDDTDMHYAAKRAVELGATRVTLLGGTGGRLDHTLANMQTLLYLAQCGVYACLADETTEIYALVAGKHVFAQRKCYASLLCAGARATGITLKGFRYCLDNAELTHTFPIGVSNEFVAQTGEIVIGEGAVYFVLSD